MSPWIVLKMKHVSMAVDYTWINNSFKRALIMKMNLIWEKFTELWKADIFMLYRIPDIFMLYRIPDIFKLYRIPDILRWWNHIRKTVILFPPTFCMVTFFSFSFWSMQVLCYLSWVLQCQVIVFVDGCYSSLN